MSAAFDRAINSEDEPANCLDSLCIAHYSLSLISLINLDNQFSFLNDFPNNFHPNYELIEG